MNVLARRAAFTANRTPVRFLQYRRAASGVTSGAGSNDQQRQAERGILADRAKRDPELYILWVIMASAFGLAGWHFSRNPTSSSSEAKVGKVDNTEPWKTGGDGKYQYHPHGDASKPRKEAPSALNEVIIPNVNLPRELHEKYNKWGKEGF